ncbi:MAG: A/G-specific DNA-adenine glycosylase [Bryobacterales bacterium]|nr:A/G-specific DNA-adenine glycosylase [Bryobacterales bacterium]
MPGWATGERQATEDDDLSYAARLLAWFDAGHRDLPWRRTRDPYRIWVSEIMLQQTRAAAAIPYYEEFLRRFPTVEALAGAPEAEVLAAWSGLGYYSRARNLRAGAALVVERGGFPSDLEAIRALPGIGPYTAAAVASIAFGLPHAVLDGNVIRVISRVSNDPGDIRAPATRKRFQAAADEWLHRVRPGAFNQAMMELGATVCLPRAPLCLVCPVNSTCEARMAGTQNQLPVKLGKVKPEAVESRVVIVRRGQWIFLRQRDADARRMAGFWELPGLEDIPALIDTSVVGNFQHTIVNQCYSVTVYRGAMPRGSAPAGGKWMKPELFTDVPITTVTRKALELLRKR